MWRKSSLRLNRSLLYRGAVGRTLFWASEFRTGAIPMKEEELGEATVAAKVFLGPLFKFRDAKRFSFLGKIEFPQEAIDPNIDGESVPTTVGVKQDAAGYFGANSWQEFEMGGSQRGG